MAKDRQEPLHDRTFKMMCVGDSITTGYPPLENSYRKYLLDALPGNDIDMVGPICWGSMKPKELNRIDAVMGRKLAEIHESLKKSLPEWKPDVILLHAGTNDVAPKVPPPDGCPEALDAILQTIVQECPGASTVVAGIMPAAFREDNIRSYNAALQGLVKKRREQGQRFVFVDMNSDWPKDCFLDIVHPNDNGYKEIARRFKVGLELLNGLGWVP